MGTENPTTMISVSSDLVVTIMQEMAHTDPILKYALEAAMWKAKAVEAEVATTQTQPTDSSLGEKDRERQVNIFPPQV